jgi:pilus assembly protein CpaF
MNTENPLSILSPLLDDPAVVQILIDGYAQVYVEKEGKLQDVPTPFQDAAHLLSIIEAAAASMGQELNESQPIADFHLSDGTHVHLETRPANLLGRGAVTAADLINRATQMRPDRILVTEVLGREALNLLEAMHTGHTGTMFTMHANGVRDVLNRFEVLVTMANPSIPLLAVREQIAASLQLVIYQEHFPDGTRRVAKISEIVGLQGDIILTQDLFEFQRTGVENGEIVGQFTPLGHIPHFLNRIREAGVDLPMTLFTPR